MDFKFKKAQPGYRCTDFAFTELFLVSYINNGKFFWNWNFWNFFFFYLEKNRNSFKIPNFQSILKAFKSEINNMLFTFYSEEFFVFVLTQFLFFKTFKENFNFQISLLPLILHVLYQHLLKRVWKVVTLIWKLMKAQIPNRLSFKKDEKNK